MRELDDGAIQIERGKTYRAVKSREDTQELFETVELGCNAVQRSREEATLPPGRYVPDPEQANDGGGATED